MAIEHNNPDDDVVIIQPGGGRAVWPLTPDELALLRGFFDFANDRLGTSRPFNPSDMFPGDNDELKALRYKVASDVFIIDIKGGTVIELERDAALPVPSLIRITVQDAIDAGLPGADAYAPRPDDDPPYPGELNAYWLVLYVYKAEKGDPGTDGTNGVDGRDGVDGTNGTNGTDGRDGVDGTNGTDGRDGVDGAPGAPGECPDCENPPPGPQPTGPGPQPTQPTGEDGGGTGGGGDGTNPDQSPGKDTTICGEPVQIYQKQMSGLRSWIFAPAQLLPTDFDYHAVNLRPGIDAVAEKTFKDYDPARLKSAKLLLDMPYLISETVPTPSPLSPSGFSSITYTPANTMPRLYADTTRTDELGQFGSGTSTDFTIPVRLNGSNKNVGLTAGLCDFVALTIDVSGNKPVYIDGSVVPLPLIAQVILDFLDGRTSARIFVSCLTYSNEVCPTLDAEIPEFQPVPFLKRWFDPTVDPDLADISGGWWSIRADDGFAADFGAYGAWRRTFLQQRYDRLHCYGFKPGVTYGVRVGTGGYAAGDFSWALVSPGFGGVQLASNTVHDPGDGIDHRIRIIECGTITIPDDWDKCTESIVTIFYGGSDFFNDFEVYEV